MALPARASVPFDLKGTNLSGLALVLRTADLAALGQSMDERFGASPGVFSHDPVVLDLSALAQDTDEVDFGLLLEMLVAHRLRAAGVRGGSEKMNESALAAGLGDVGDDTGGASLPRDRPDSGQETAPAPAVALGPPLRTRELPENASTAIAPTLIVDKPLRSGQQVYAKGGDLVVLATVNVGAEVIADGSIHVYGPLRGKAVAGARGNTGARIFSTCMEPQLLAIAGTYRTTETPLPDDVVGKSAQIRLDGDRLVFEPIG